MHPVSLQPNLKQRWQAFFQQVVANGHWVRSLLVGVLVIFALVGFTTIAFPGQPVALSPAPALAEASFGVTAAGEVLEIFVCAGQITSIKDTTWVIAGRTVQVDATTVIDEGLAVGNEAVIIGTLTAKGIVVATHILRAQASSTFEFVGVVQSIGPTVWTFSGLTVNVDSHTTMAPRLAVGQRVRVLGVVLPNGTWQATTITLAAELVGCLNTSTIVQSVNGTQLTLLSGQVIDLQTVKIDGEIHQASAIIVQSCSGLDGVLRPVSLRVIQHLEALPPASATANPDPASSSKVVICHIPPGNPGNRHTLIVGAPAVNAHVANHGDTLGPCPSEKPGKNKNK